MSIEELPADWQGEVRRLRRENQQLSSSATRPVMLWRRWS